MAAVSGSTVASMIYAGAPGPDPGTERTVAQKIQTLVIDHLDGSPAENTVRLALDGTSYEIDLSGEHAQARRGRPGLHQVRGSDLRRFLCAVVKLAPAARVRLAPFTHSCITPSLFGIARSIRV